MKTMKRIARTLVVLSTAFFAFVSCDNKNNLPTEESIFSKNALIDAPEEGHFSDPLDQWIYDEFTKPYNIRVIWRADDREHKKSAIIAPPHPDKVKEFLVAMKHLWIEPYAEEAGPSFIEKYAPKLIFLGANAQYNPDGTATEGVAEGGRKITILDINRFSISTPEAVTKAFHTMHHEFGHILNQRKPFSDAYALITKGRYTAAWINKQPYEATTQGYITPYSMMNEYEDFVEIAGTILSTVMNSNTPTSRPVPLLDENYKYEEGKEITKEMTAFEYKLHTATLGYMRNPKTNELGPLLQFPNGPEGMTLLHKKVDMVRAYYQDSWGIDIFQLQKRIERAAIKLVQEKGNTKK